MESIATNTKVDLFILFEFCRKKLSTFTHNQDWNHAGNYVAKRYIDDVANKVYFDDVRIQMDAKVWAEEYNRQNPPKKVK